MTGWIIGSLILFFLAAVYFFAIMPSFGRREECMELAGWNYAHRGLWNEEEKIPENSLPAFARAVRDGYAIELDVQLTRDRELVVFHDDTLLRMCGAEGRIRDYTLEELGSFHLQNTCCKIPAFREVLEVVDGKVPLLVELKMPDKNPMVCAVLNRELIHYTGLYCIESFNSLALRWYRENMPDILRGQLSGRFSARDGQHAIVRMMATQLMFNFVGRPDFIAYDYRYATCPGFVINHALFKTPTFAWTVRSHLTCRRIRGKFDAIIFERFFPGRDKKEC
ncbi:MAG: glycerophosphodiester phosphodiesterase family protein [Fusicatenibacter sp.]